MIKIEKKIAFFYNLNLVLEEHPDEELNLTPSSSNSTQIQNLSPIKKEKSHYGGSNNNLNSSTTSNNSFSNNNNNNNASFNNGGNDDRSNIQDMRDRPLTLHNMKSSTLASAKTEALIASLGFKSSSFELKNRINNNNNNNKKTFLKKPLKKRLKGIYLK